ncbi:MAG: DUF3566 domain-containing protein [Acidimicrobiales bacterium]
MRAVRKAAAVRHRRSREVVRKIDAWSVLKVSVVFYVTLYCILLVAGIILWLAATATGLRHNVEKFIADLIASGKFHFVASELLRAATIGGAVLVVMGTAANVLLVVLYNLISDMVGGLSIVVEERPSRRAASQATAAAAVAEAQPTPVLVPEAELRQGRRPPERGPTTVTPRPSNL